MMDYNSKFSIVKRLEGLLAKNLTNVVKIILAEYGILRKNNVRHWHKFCFW